MLQMLTSTPVVSICHRSSYLRCLVYVGMGYWLKQLQLQVMRCSTDSEGYLFDHISTDTIAAAVRKQLNIELASQLISIPKPLDKVGQHQAMLRITLPDGKKAMLQVLLTGL